MEHFWQGFSKTALQDAAMAQPPEPAPVEQEGGGWKKPLVIGGTIAGTALAAYLGRNRIKGMWNKLRPPAAAAPAAPVAAAAAPAEAAVGTGLKIAPTTSPTTASTAHADALHAEHVNALKQRQAAAAAAAPAAPAAPVAPAPATTAQPSRGLSKRQHKRQKELAMQEAKRQAAQPPSPTIATPTPTPREVPNIPKSVSIYAPGARGDNALKGVSNYKAWEDIPAHAQQRMSSRFYELRDRVRQGQALSPVEENFMERMSRWHGFA